MSHKLLLIAGSVGAMVLAASACTVEVNDDGGYGGAGGGTGGTSSVGNGTGGTGGSVGDGGAGGSVACMGCAAFLTACNMGACPDDPNFCDGSETLVTDATSCVCAADVCGTECAATCTEMGDDESTCVGCMAAALTSNADECLDEGQACFADM